MPLWAPLRLSDGREVWVSGHARKRAKQRIGDGWRWALIRAAPVAPAVVALFVRERRERRTSAADRRRVVAAYVSPSPLDEHPRLWLVADGDGDGGVVLTVTVVKHGPWRVVLSRALRSAGEAPGLPAGRR